MTNFFNNNLNNGNLNKTPFTIESNESSIDNQYDNLKENYQKIFIEAAESIRKEINAFKPEDPCSSCPIKSCKIEKKDVFADYPVGCKYKDWQIQVLTFLNGEYKQKLKNSYKALMDKKQEYTCARCGNCCKLATSEMSYAQLKQRAMRGDKFAKDFVSVYVPYKSEEQAKQTNPEYTAKLEELMDDEKIYYYYCSKFSNGECSIYEKRPNICRDFPHNPLKLLPSSCSFNEWKKSVSKFAMLLKAKTDLIEFYKEQLG